MKMIQNEIKKSIFKKDTKDCHFENANTLLHNTPP